MANNTTSLLAPDHLIIQTLQEFDGSMDPDANSLFANASSVFVGNDTINTVLLSNGIITSAIQFGDETTNVNINSTSFNISSFGGSNTHIDAYQANFSGYVSVGTGLLLNGELNANGQPGTNGQVLVSDGTIPYWSDSANNALYLGGVAAADYQTEAGLSANVATLTANNTSYVGSVTAANVVSNSQLSSNLANYQTTAGLSANIATLAANSATYLGGSGNFGNTTGIYSSGVVNAASHSVGTTFVANSSQLTITTPLSANGGTGTAGYVLTSNGATGSPYWSAASGGGFTNGQSISVANLTITGSFTANGTTGTAGQILTSNGTATYWSSVSASVNTAAVVAFSNTTASGNAVTGAVTIAGGLGVANNIYAAGRIGWSNSTNVSVAYMQYNATTGSVDMVFG